jgi:hypothetical protein
MLVAALLVAGVGLLVGLRYKVPALAAASVVTAAGTVLAGIFLGWPVLEIGGRMLVLLAALQTAYVAGLVLGAVRGSR